MWNRWLKKLWKDRLKGLGGDLTKQEADRMLEWTARLEPVFSGGGRLGLPR